MKTFVIFVALFGFGLCAEMKYSNDPTNPCVMLDVDATFATTVTRSGSQPSTKTVVTDSNSYASGSCTNSLTTFVVTFNETGAKWKLTFTIGDNQEVQLSSIFQYSAAEMFPDESLTDTVILTEDGQMTLSKSDKSFKCNAEQTVDFKPSTIGGNTYTVTLTLKMLQVQAFNLNGNTFSDATECAADSATTSESTTEKSTSEGSSTPEGSSSSSSSSPTTSTTPATTTTEAPPSPVNTYEVKENDETCLIMVAGIAVTVEYEAKDNSTKTTRLDVPESAKFSGQCSNDSAVSANLTITFSNNSIEFTFADTDSKVELQEATLTVTLDATNFPDAKNPGSKITLKKENVLPLSDDNTFYTCNSRESVSFQNGASLDLMDVKVQAFNLNNGSFSGDGTECSADQSTTTGASTSATSPATTTPKPSVPVNNYTISDGEKTCLLMKAAFVLKITYMKKNSGMTTQSVDIPQLSSSNYNGTCGNTTEELNIMFFQDTWAINLVFQDAGSSVASDGLVGAVQNYQLTNVSVTYAFDDNLPDAEASGTATARAGNVNKFQAGVAGSYKCNAETTLSVNNNVTLVVTDLQYQAFQTGNSTTFNSGDLTECDADLETNSVVPIAVGAALAGLVVIVLIAYLIGRRKSRRAGYESV